jgi:signal transduction histidine kinase
VTASGHRPDPWLEEACKLVLVFRAFALLLTVLDVPERGHVPLLTVAFIVAGLVTYVPLRHWDRVAPAIARRPSYLAAEIVLSALILALTGTDSPFFLFTLGTAALGGLIYGITGAGVFATLLIGAYAWVFSVRADLDGIPETFQTVFGQPALYLAAALAGAASRHLSTRQAEAADRAASAGLEVAAERERARLARDMHDSLAKTVHGIALSAAALARHIERDPAGAAVDARRLASDAETAAREARGLIHGLRAEGTGPLSDAVAQRAQAFAERTGLPVRLELGDVDAGPAARHELVQILEEALRNVERHAASAQVTVTLAQEDGLAVLGVRDDGPGFEEPGDSKLRDDLHFGLVGMRERAALVGGRLDVDSAAGAGTSVIARVPVHSEGSNDLGRAVAT